MHADIEENKNVLYSLVDRSIDYGKTTFELEKHKAVDKISEVVSSVVPHTFVLTLFSSFLLFLNLGLALWVGEMLGKVFYGFFVVAAFYIITGIGVHFLLHKSMKKAIRNYVINQLLK
jgi:hypothetical protein